MANDEKDIVSPLCRRSYPAGRFSIAVGTVLYCACYYLFLWVYEREMKK